MNERSEWVMEKANTDELHKVIHDRLNSVLPRGMLGEEVDNLIAHLLGDKQNEIKNVHNQWALTCALADTRAMKHVSPMNVISSRAGAAEKSKSGHKSDGADGTPIPNKG